MLRFPFLLSWGDVLSEGLQGLAVDLEGSGRLRVASHDVEQLRREWLSLIPVVLVPLLKVPHLSAGEPHVEFDVARQTRTSEVGGPHQSRRSDHVQCAVGDVRLRVELAVPVDPRLDLPGAKSLHDRGKSCQERIRAAFGCQ